MNFRQRQVHRRFWRLLSQASVLSSGANGLGPAVLVLLPATSHAFRLSWLGPRVWNHRGVPPAAIGAPLGEPLDLSDPADPAGRPTSERFAKSAVALGNVLARRAGLRSIQLPLAGSASRSIVSSEPAVP